MQGSADYSSLDAQEDQLRAYCKVKSWDVSGVYKDTKSGGTLERDELHKLLQDAEKGKFDVIVTTKIDRLSRSIADFQNLTNRLNELGLDFVSST
ncbi:MAG: recombinase family protein [Bacteroidetes bacterium]|nr:recombinase family protein [Bacteroidota bacterium]